ncbi:unnamed protein product [Lactuca saligna]|uniref:non-specific serine/threonine protein kinase n=1 Tax=Lactuca saligna TaxID=75948 RepID=A0AA35VCM2_LACSI|nr:unnamed protein product [Lactuca saligna]
MSSSWKELVKFRIPLEEIRKATNEFNPENQIGNGGFGTVYKGKLSQKWSEADVAFKCLDPQCYQGSHEFYNEVMIVSKFKDPNIISFIGYCNEDSKMIIVYEYANQGSLDSHLARPDLKRSLTWEKRLKICLGAATGLMNLHAHSNLENQEIVIHRDVKSANILLDEDLNAKICDFGLSKFGPKDSTHTQMFTRPAGTNFYIDPYYNATHRLSGKADVYSFGVVLFEMLRGTLAYLALPIEDDKNEYLIGQVWRLYDKHPKKLIDPFLSSGIDEKSFEKFKEVAFDCIQVDAGNRPSMSMVMQKLQLAVKFHDIAQNSHQN